MNTETQLSKLPSRIADPIRNLLKHRQLQPCDVECIAQAAELTQDYSQLLGFSVLALGDPWLMDVVKLAHQHQYRIQLNWSKDQWRETERRLDRRREIALAKAEAESYPTAKYEQFLPRQYPGYLVQTPETLFALEEKGMLSDQATRLHDDLVRGKSALLCLRVQDQQQCALLEISPFVNRPLILSEYSDWRKKMAITPFLDECHSKQFAQHDLTTPLSHLEEQRFKKVVIKKTHTEQSALFGNNDNCSVWVGKSPVAIHQWDDLIFKTGEKQTWQQFANTWMELFCNHYDLMRSQDELPSKRIYQLEIQPQARKFAMCHYDFAPLLRNKKRMAKSKYTTMRWAW